MLMSFRDVRCRHEIIAATAITLRYCRHIYYYAACLFLSAYFFQRGLLSHY